MLQSGSYWGEQNLAYHQALPLVALLAAAWCNFAARGSGAGRLSGVALLGLLAGLAYVSGAIAALVMGTGWLLLARLTPERAASDMAARGRRGGAALTAAGLVTTVMQMALTRRSGADAVGQAMRLTWPTEPDFWLYAAGKLGRSSGHGFSMLGVEAVWVAALALTLLGAAVLAWRCVRRGGAAGQRVAWRFLPLAAAMLVYLALVSLGRASLRDPGVQSPAEVFRFAYLRFHFFWLTLLLPWAAAVWVRCFTPSPFGGRQGWGPAAVASGTAASPHPYPSPEGEGEPRSGGHGPIAYMALAALVLALAAARGVFNIAPHYQSASAFRAGEIRCLSRQLGAGRPIMCPGFDLVGISDWNNAYRYAREINASFVRYLPIVAHEGWGAPLFDWDDSAQRARAQWRDARPQADGWIDAGPDPQLIVPLSGNDPSARQCAVLGVQMTLAIKSPDSAQLFFRSAGQAAYTEAASVRQALVPDPKGQAWVEFVVDSEHGFEPEVRIDPIDGPGRFRLLSARVTCRLRGAP
jgi:hypothetical protein